MANIDAISTESNVLYNHNWLNDCDDHFTCPMVYSLFATSFFMSSISSWNFKALNELYIGTVM